VRPRINGGRRVGPACPPLHPPPVSIQARPHAVARNDRNDVRTVSYVCEDMKHSHGLLGLPLNGTQRRRGSCRGRQNADLYRSRTNHPPGPSKSGRGQEHSRRPGPGPDPSMQARFGPEAQSACSGCPPSPSSAVYDTGEDMAGPTHVPVTKNREGRGRGPDRPARAFSRRHGACWPESAWEITDGGAFAPGGLELQPPERNGYSTGQSSPATVDAEPGRAEVNVCTSALALANPRQEPIPRLPRTAQVKSGPAQYKNFPPIIARRVIPGGLAQRPLRLRPAVLLVRVLVTAGPPRAHQPWTPRFAPCLGVSKHVPGEPRSLLRGRPRISRPGPDSTC